MSTGNEPGTGTAATFTDRLRAPRAWIDPKRKRFWLLVLLAVYTLCGFFLAPWIAQRQTVDILSGMLGRPVQLEQVRVNPFVLSVEARGFRITESDARPLLGFDRLYVNFQLRSLFHWAWTFREITLERPSLAFERYADGTSNLSRLADDATAASPAAPAEDDESADDAGLLRLIIDEFNLIEGGGSFSDHTPATPFEAPIGPINVAVHDISTLPDERGAQRVEVHTERGANLSWQGTLQVQPLHSDGHFTAEGPFLPLAYRYFQDVIGAELTEGMVSLEFDYEVAVTSEGDLQASVSGLTYSARDVLVSQEGREIFKLPMLRLDGGYLNYPEQRAGATALAIDAPELLVWLDADGRANVERLIVSAPEAAGAEAPSEASSEVPPEAPSAEPPGPWALALERFEINDLVFTLEDQSLRSPGQIRINDLDLALQDLNNQANARFPARLAVGLDPGGAVLLEGEVGALPQPALKAALTIDALALAMAQPYLADVAAVAIEDGQLNASIDLELADDQALDASGAVSIDALALADTLHEEDLVSWQRLGVDRFVYSQSAASLALSEIELRELFLRLRIAEDRTTNFGQLVLEDEADAADTTATSAAGSHPAAGDEPDSTGLHVTVGRFVIADGAADFTDLSLPLPFHSDISTLNGEISTLDTSSTEPSQVRLEGQIADYGLARIQGDLMPLAPDRSTDIEVLFRNVALPDLTPYTIRFAGREIDSGRMEVALTYRVDEGRLQGSNSVVISDLALGERVEHPDAFNLPLALAVALLKGPDGKIDVDVPVQGDVNDPEFRIGGVILKAVVNLITGIVTSPFRLLGNLVGADSEDLGRLEFEPGSASLTPPEREKLLKLGEALALRPQLTLEIAGVYDPEADLTALKEQAVAARIDAGLQARQADGAPDQMLTEARRATVEALFSADFPDVPLEQVQAGFHSAGDPDAPDAAPVLDQTAYVAELERRLVDAAPLGEADLQTLAAARADAVASGLGELATSATGRIATGTSTTAEMTESGWILMELEVDAGAAAGAAADEPAGQSAGEPSPQP